MGRLMRRLHLRRLRRAKIQTRSAAVRELCEDRLAIFNARGAQCGTTPHDALDCAVLIRVKANRIITMVLEGIEPDDEEWRDIANYADIAVLTQRGYWRRDVPW